MALVVVSHVKVQAQASKVIMIYKVIKMLMVCISAKLEKAFILLLVVCVCVCVCVRGGGGEAVNVQ